MEARRVLRRPLLTEKATIAREIGNEYAFEVDLDANKIQIKSAVEELYSVKVEKVRTVRRQGKLKRQGMHEGRRPRWKKAMITLAEGNTIELFDQL